MTDESVSKVVHRHFPLIVLPFALGNLALMWLGPGGTFGVTIGLVGVALCILFEAEVLLGRGPHAQ